ncbi:MAG: hypothetical protein ACE5R4_18840, partial [Armatimonadota bacterium]
MPYDVGSYKFDVTEFFTDDCFAAITDVRVREPESVYEHAKKRKRRQRLTAPLEPTKKARVPGERRPRIRDEGRLVILAADHPGRNITKSED